MNYRILCCICAFVLSCALPGPGLAMGDLPEALYPELETLLALPQADAAPDTDQIKQLVAFLRAIPAETSLNMKDRGKATGAFHTFNLRGDLSRIANYVYNPDVPVYATMPSSVRGQEWLTPWVEEPLRRLPDALEDGQVFFVRGQEREVITPDANTGGYYTYVQDRAVTVVSTADGPVLISVSCQPEPSEVGRKGCVVGADSNWNYLYSDETGLTKAGLGWVDSYMYDAYSALVYVPDMATGMVKVGSFKWLNAGWAKMNMVKTSHILNGIKRFSADFKAVLEAPALPTAKELAARYQNLSRSSELVLRGMVEPYVLALGQNGGSDVKSSPFKGLLKSGDYLHTMSPQEMVKVLLQEYIKSCIGRETLVRISATDSGLAVSALP